MNVAASWFVILLIFAVALLAADYIGKGFDWVLDRLWGQPNTQSWAIEDDFCSCSLDRDYHSKMAGGRDE